MNPSFHYKASLVSIHDGDTITVDIDLGFHVTYRTPIRLNGINAPELATDAGKQSRDHLQVLVGTGDLTIVTYKNPVDKYGRWLADVYYQDVCLNHQMVQDGFAKDWNGQGVKPV